MNKTERQARREVPLEDLLLNQPTEASLAATKPHVAPTDLQKAKTKRGNSSLSKSRKAHAQEKGAERAQKLEKRRDSVEGKKAKKQRSKLLWD